MRARPAQIQPVQRRAVAAPTRDGAHEENLVESKLSVVEVALGEIQLIGALQHEPRFRGLDLGDVGCDNGDHGGP